MNVAAAVSLIWESARRGVYGPAELKGTLSRDDAYRIQLGLLARYVEAGDTHAGWKVGLTAKAMQIQQGVHEPVFGFLLGRGQRPSGTVFAFGELIQPGFENELCLTIGTSLQGPGVTTDEALAAISSVAPALEVIERRGDFAGDLNLALADNAQQKAFVTGEATALRRGGDLGDATVDVFVNGQHSERASGTEVMGTPAASVAWLANTLAGFGLRLHAGMRVMSGSFTRQYAVNRGDRVEARFVPFGPVSADFR
jgi:2-keto-4-pentenoate hydratase